MVSLIEIYSVFENTWRFRGSPTKTRQTTVNSILANMEVGEEIEFSKNEYKALYSASQRLKNKGEGNWSLKTVGDKLKVKRVSDTSTPGKQYGAGTYSDNNVARRMVYTNPTVVSQFLKMKVGDDMAFSINKLSTVADTASTLKKQGEGMWAVNKRGNEIVVKRLSDKQETMGKFDRTGIGNMISDMSVGDEVSVGSEKLHSAKNVVQRLKKSGVGNWSVFKRGDEVVVKRTQ